MSYRILPVLLTLGLVPALVWGQESPGSGFFQRLTVDDGLPENSVRAILQDRRGFLWFGTQSGLARYDGHEMVDRWHTSGDANAVPRMFVSALAEDPAGFIWIGTLLHGLWRLDPSTESFEPIVCENEPDRADAVEANAEVAGLCLDSEGNVWVAWARRGLCRHDSAGACLERLVHDPTDPSTPPSSKLNSVFEDAQGNLWVGTQDEGLALRESTSRGFRSFRHGLADPTSLADDQVNAVYQAPDGRIWVSTFQGLSCWIARAGHFRRYLPDPPAGSSMDNYLLQMTAAADGGMWIGSAVGLYHFDPVTESFFLHAHDPNDPRSPVKGPVLSLWRDRSGIIWAGSWHAGLNKFDPLAMKFSYLGHDPNDPTSLDDDAVMAILEDSPGNVWVGTGSMSSGGSDGGLNRLRPGSEIFEHIGFPAGSGVRAVESLCEDHEGRIWAGTTSGLWRFDIESDALVRAHRDSTSTAGVADVAVRGLAVDDDGDLWVCAFRYGVYRIDPRTGAVRRWVHDPDDPSSISQNTLIFAYPDRQGRVWIGADTGGLNLYQPQTNDFRRHFDLETGLTSVTTMHEDARGRLWVGTYAGLLRFDPELGVVDAYTTRRGLPHDMVSAILEDDRGRLWLSTGRGVARFDPDSGQIRSYDVRDGLPGNEASFARHRGRTGRFYFGGNHGLVFFDPNRILDNPFVPPVALTELWIGDTLQHPGAEGPLPRGLSYLQDVTLTHRQNDLTFTFAALDFSHPERNRHRFRLVNFDSDWREAGTRRTATYTNLQPGSYRFEVQGSNADGLWNEASTTLDLVITPPWWRTGVAKVAYVLLALLLAAAIYQQIVQRERIQAALRLERAEARQLHKLDEFKSRFFANISHEFRTPLTLIQAPLQRLREDPTAGDRVLFDMMSRNARRLRDLIDQLLDLSRLEAGRLPLRWQNGDWLAFLRALVSSFDSLAQTRGVELVSDLPHLEDRAWYDPDVLEKVVTNLLSNAFRFTPDGGTVRVTGSVLPDKGSSPVPSSTSSDDAMTPITASVRWLQIEVANTGSYIPPADRVRIFERFQQLGQLNRGGTGVGLSLVKELVEWMQGQIEVDSDRESGTRFTVVLPLFQEPPVLGLEPGGEEETTRLESEEEPLLQAAAAAGATSEDVLDARGERRARAVEEVELPLVLVVEDHPDLRSFLARGLRSRYRVLEASDGDAGLHLAVEEVPDLLLSDVMMPGIDGFELCRRVKEDERTSHIPVILLTARVEAESRRAGLQIGADDYIAKPFDVEELQIRVENLIEQRRRLAKKYAQQVAGLAPEAMPVTSADERFLVRARGVVEQHLDDPDLDVATLCREIGVSRAQLHRKLKSLTGQSTSEFVRAHRLQRAAELLKGGYGNVTEVAYAVGFQSLSYFGRSFREQYGKTPSEYLDRS